MTTALPQGTPVSADAAPDMLALAQLCQERGFRVSGIADNAITAEQPIPGHPSEKREIVFHRDAVGDWLGGCCHARLVCLITTVGGFAVPNYSRSKIILSHKLLTLQAAADWLRGVTERRS